MGYSKIKIISRNQLRSILDFGVLLSGIKRQVIGALVGLLWSTYGVPMAYIRLSYGVPTEFHRGSVGAWSGESRERVGAWLVATGGHGCHGCHGLKSVVMKRNTPLGLCAGLRTKIRFF